MSYDTNTTVHSRVINAFFDTQAAATKAVDDLIAAGIPNQHITQTGGQSTATSTAAVDTYEDKGFWESLKDLFIPEEDRYTYAEGLRRGGYLVSVRTEEANYDRVLDILDNEGSVDLDERETQWRAEGWTGYAGEGLAAASATGLVSAPAASATAYETTTASNIRTTGRAAKVDTTAQALRTDTAPLATGQDDTVQLYEENLRVGKRDVNHGRVRLRSYVVETPVSEQVSLRNEKVTIDRKAVDRPVAVGEALFQDRVIEVEEHSEEAIVAKEARVTEEVSLRKTAENRTETVTDSVRRTEVEVQDDRTLAAGTKASAFSAKTDSARIVEHMDVISADGKKIGTVDHLDGPDKIKLAKNTSPDGQHHMVPFTWIDHVDQHVHLRKTLSEIKAGL